MLLHILQTMMRNVGCGCDAQDLARPGRDHDLTHPERLLELQRTWHGRAPCGPMALDARCSKFIMPMGKQTHAEFHTAIEAFALYHLR